MVTQEIAGTSHVFCSYIPSGVESTSERWRTSEELGVARRRKKQPLLKAKGTASATICGQNSVPEGTKE